MLDTSVDVADIDDAARAWRQQGRNTTDAITGLSRDLTGIVFDGWRGASADAALTALGPINQWSANQADTAARTTQLMDDSASSVSQAKSAVPPPVSHDWKESLLSFAVGGGAGVVTDAVAQEQQKIDAHAEAVRVMTNVYSTPINDHRAAVPTYPQLADPTVQQPEQPLDTGPAPGALYSAPATGKPVTAGSATGRPATGGPGTRESATGGHASGVGALGGGHVAHLPPTAATLQGVSTDPAQAGIGQAPADQVTRRAQHGEGRIAATTVAAAAAGVPIMAPATDKIRRALEPHGVRLGGGAHVSGEGQHAGTGTTAEFEPHPLGAAAAEARIGRGAGAGAGNLMAPMGGAGRGKDGEDSEHRRPSYLIEMDDVFSDGRKVAPAVIGQDPPEQDHSP